MGPAYCINLAAMGRVPFLAFAAMLCWPVYAGAADLIGTRSNFTARASGCSARRAGVAANLRG